MVGPDDANQAGRVAEGHDPVKRDNHSNPFGFRPRAGRVVRLADRERLPREALLHRHRRPALASTTRSTRPAWRSFRPAPWFDANSRLGRPPGDPDSNDPNALVMQYYTYDEPTGGLSERRRHARRRADRGVPLLRRAGRPDVHEGREDGGLTPGTAEGSSHGCCRCRGQGVGVAEAPGFRRVSTRIRPSVASLNQGSHCRRIVSSLASSSGSAVLPLPTT